MQINRITYVPDFGSNNSPASVDRKKGHCFINAARWKNIKPEHRVFILLHENAHCVLDTSDEQKVDELAQKWYIAAGYSLTESVKALTGILHDKSPENRIRAWKQYQRALEVDKLNDKLEQYDGYTELAARPDVEITNVLDNYDGSITVYFDHFDLNELDKVKGLSRKEMRKKKRAVRMYKRLGRGKKKHAVANDIQAGADTRKTYAEQGIYVPTRAESVAKGVGQTIQGIAGAFGAQMGGGGAMSAASAEEETAPEYEPQSFTNSTKRSINPQEPATATPGAGTAKAKSNTNVLLIGAAVAAFLVIGAVIYKARN